MVIPYQYTYFIGVLVFFIAWVVLLLLRKDLWKEMVVMGLLLAFISPLTAYIWWTVDWWRPQNITGTIVGIEDVLLGFFTAGIAAVLYEVLFRRRLYRPSGFRVSQARVLAISFLIMIAIGFGIWVSGLNSFQATVIAVLATLLCIFINRKDLLLPSFINGLLMAVLSFSFYYVCITISPGWVEDTYLFDYLSGVKITAVPIEEIIFWFLYGMLIAPGYEYWQGYRLRKMSTHLKRR